MKCPLKKNNGSEGGGAIVESVGGGQRFTRVIVLCAVVSPEGGDLFMS